MAATWQAFRYQPLISIVTPVYNPPELFLRQAIDSVLNQIYPHWELCVADDASSALHVRPILEEYAARDSRIKVTFRSQNGHISRCSNSALELATGDFVALLDHDDLLTPNALYEVVLLLNRHPEADMIYSDEDRIDDRNQLQNPFFKPDWSPDSFLSRMYTCHLGVYRRALLMEIGGFRAEYEGSQDYDLVLRFTEKTKHIFHIPKILYHWRIHQISAASGGEAKPYAFIAAEKALNDALVRRQELGKVAIVRELIGAYIARYLIEGDRTVTIIISVTSIDWLHECLTTIQQSTASDYEIIFVSDRSLKSEIAEVVSHFDFKRFQHLACETKNLSQCLNQAARKGQGKYLLFLNGTTKAATSDWIDALIEQAQRSSIGAASGLLLLPNNTVWHAGIVLGLNGIAGYIHRHLPANGLGYFGQIISINNYSAVTGNCLMCRRDLFEQVGGFTEALPSTYYDVDFCLKLQEKGLKNVVLPHVVLYYNASESDGLVNQQEAIYMRDRWQSMIQHDPHYNPNLSLERSDYSIKVNQRHQSPNAHRLEAELAKVRAERDRLQQRLKKTQARLDEIKQEFEQACDRMAAMETSKFWQVRVRWLRLKKKLGLPVNE
ncbi:glycosyltransferase [Microcoleus sp. FACHB-1515]|uniref:glycosyltransferase n=1 Tax=Cyanophyceae TaxID=3028117 RepID=UPI0016890B97|nr:glycosyltransferase [Microcoleus sp. FACHB-1515]MBD2088486.1 glycosyltransferase [Microcoleus sp. FACHB-1515]